MAPVKLDLGQVPTIDSRLQRVLWETETAKRTEARILLAERLSLPKARVSFHRSVSRKYRKG
jgi:hypothetical protein